MTFREYQILNELWSEDQLFFTKTTYESMRLQTYFQFSLQVSKRHKKSYEQFIRQYMPFTWDLKAEKSEDQKKLEAMTPEDWAELDRRAALRARGPIITSN